MPPQKSAETQPAVGELVYLPDFDQWALVTQVDPPQVVRLGQATDYGLTLDRP